MEQFLIELEALLDGWNAAIVRSADDNHNLVVSIPSPLGGFDEIEFEEDITKESIDHKWYKYLAKSE